MTQTKTDKPKGAIVADPELAAMGKIAKVLSTLPEDSRYRVMGWVLSRFKSEKMNYMLMQNGEEPPK